MLAKTCWIQTTSLSKVSQADFDVIETRLTVESKSVTAFEKNARVSFVVSDQSEVLAGLLNFFDSF